MRKLSVEVLEAASHPDGGYAVILLHGLESLPDGATFRIKPVEAKGVHEGGAAWPVGEQRPRAVRRNDAGIELLIGPDIVECPALIPGTLGVIEIQAAAVRGEFLWPSIKPTARPRRRHLSVVKPVASRAPQPAAAVAPAVVMIPASAALQPAATGTDGLAALSRRRTGDSSSEAVANEPPAPVTALDHASPPSASIDEATGGKVVQLDSRRETVAPQRSPAAASWWSMRRTRKEAGFSFTPTRDEEGAAKSELLPAAMRRPAAIAASIAVLLSGGWLLLGTGTRASDPQVEMTRENAPPAMPSPRARVVVEEVVVRETPRTQIAAMDQGVAAQPSAPREAEREPAAAAPAPQAAPASQEVTLRMRGGGFQISGELRGFDGAKYVIESRTAGSLTMDASRFECIGEACARPAAAILPLSERPSPVKPDVFRIEGASALAAEFMPQLVRDYAASLQAVVKELPREGSAGARLRIEDRSGVELATIEVASSGTAAAAGALERGSAAIALIDRPLVPDPRPASRPAVRSKTAPPAQPTELTVGLDGVAAVASPAIAPGAISLDNLAKVIAGRITDWYELGMAPGPIHLYLPADGTGTMDTLVRQLLRPRGLEPSRAARRAATDGEAADAATRDPRGLAVVGLAAQRGAKAINLQTSCGLIVRPTSFAIKTGEYPLIRRLSLQIPTNLQLPAARGLIRLAQSGDVAAAVSAAGLVDQSITSLPIEEQAERLAWAANAPAASFDMAHMRQMLADLDGATRLSVTLRFVAGTNDLDQRSRADLARLAGAMKEPELAGRRIILAGFADAGGKFRANLAASQKRAWQVRSALATAAGPGLDQKLVVAKGYGSLAPVACNGETDGSRLNRRVEVWVSGGVPERLGARLGAR